MRALESEFKRKSRGLKRAKKRSRELNRNKKAFSFATILKLIQEATLFLVRHVAKMF